MPTRGINLSVLAGSLSRPPAVRSLPSGDRLVALEVTVRSDDLPADTVPVAWFDAPDAALAWEASQEVVVVGRVRRRFFRAGASTVSRTEVVASTVLAASRRAGARKAVRAALERVEATMEG